MNSFLCYNNLWIHSGFFRTQRSTDEYKNFLCISYTFDDGRSLLVQSYGEKDIKSIKNQEISRYYDSFRDVVNKKSDLKRKNRYFHKMIFGTNMIWLKIELRKEFITFFLCWDEIKALIISVVVSFFWGWSCLFDCFRDSLPCQPFLVVFSSLKKQIQCSYSTYVEKNRLWKYWLISSYVVQNRLETKQKRCLHCCIP